MCKLVNVSEDLEHAEVFLAHQSLLLLLDVLDTHDLFLANSDQAMLDLVTDVLLAVVQSVDELVSGCDDVLL